MPDLSPREAETLRLAVSGLSVAEIGVRLALSAHSVQVYLTRAARKLRQKTRP